jgi:D-alanyl-D-alanine carboxypeptidase/D-alanyl-D-alanine-endopeptidase (penicillin-binding protein 4)
MGRQSVKVEGDVRLVRDAGEFKEVKKKRICIFESSLIQAIEIANKRSQNFYAEQILKTLGAEKRGHGSFKSGSTAVQDFMKEVGILPGTYSYRDGSGLSKHNKLSPRQIAAVLEYMYRHECAAAYVNSLAVAGTDGSLASRMGYAPLKGNVLAKTGSLANSGVHCISGYIRCGSGGTAAFTILFNKSQKGRVDIRRLEEKILVAIYRHAPSKGEAHESVNIALKGTRHLLKQN